MIRIVDSSASSNNENLNISGYKLLRADHPGNVKRSDICMYFKESLPVRFLAHSYLKECFILEVSINNKGGLFHCTSHLVKLLINLTHLSLI